MNRKLKMSFLLEKFILNLLIFQKIIPKQNKHNFQYLSFNS